MKDKPRKVDKKAASNMKALEMAEKYHVQSSLSPRRNAEAALLLVHKYK